MKQLETITGLWCTYSRNTFTSQPSLPSLATPPSSPPSNSTRNFRVYAFNMAIYKIIVTCIDCATVFQGTQVLESLLDALIVLQYFRVTLCTSIRIIVTCIDRATVFQGTQVLEPLLHVLIVLQYFRVTLCTSIRIIVTCIDRATVFQGTQVLEPLLHALIVLQYFRVTLCTSIRIIVTCIDRATVLCTSIRKPKLSELQMKSLVDMQDTAPSICNATVCYIANTNKLSV